MNPRVTAAKAIGQGQLWLQFSNGEQRHFSVLPYLQYPVYQALSNDGLFKEVAVFNGTVCWGEDGAVDFDPDTLYLESVPAMQAAV